MKVIGIVAEYNPLHNGHAYQIQYAKEALGASHVIVVMSGNFTQRGTPALFDKNFRAACALKCGVDTVFELPCVYATASAELFASAAVRTLEATGIVDTLLFGCETPDLTKLQTTADILLDEPAWYQETLRKQLASGCSYALARESALNAHGIDTKVLHQSNNILAIEYLKAIKKYHCKMKPVAMLRSGDAYNNNEIQSHYASASALRSLLQSQTNNLPHEIDSSNVVDTDLLLAQIPAAVQQDLLQRIHAKDYLFEEDFSLLLHNALLRTRDYATYFDCNEDLSNRILQNLKEYEGYHSFIKLLQTKNIASSRIQRVLCHVLLDIKCVDTACNISYLRLLGINNSHGKLLREVKNNSAMPLIAYPKDVDKSILSKAGQEMLQKDLLADDIYRCVRTEKTGKIYPNEYTRRFLTIN